MPRVLRAGDGRVTQIELFFDLVYVFAVTQLAHLLVTHTTVDGAVRTAVLLAMVWQIWVYTTWMTNYLDPDTQPVRLGLIALMLASLVLAAAIPEAFGSRGWLVASMYVVDAGRPQPARRRRVARASPRVRVLARGRLVRARRRPDADRRRRARPRARGAVGADGCDRDRRRRNRIPHARHRPIRDQRLDDRRRAFRRALPGVRPDRAGRVDRRVRRASLRIAARALRQRAGSSRSSRPSSLPLRCGGSTSTAAPPTARERSRSRTIPGRLGRNAFHWVHPIIVAGIIVSAAADEVVLARSHRARRACRRRGSCSAASRCSWPATRSSKRSCGGSFRGRASSRCSCWCACSRSRRTCTALVLGVATLAVAIAVAVADRVQHGVLAADSAATTD